MFKAVIMSTINNIERQNNVQGDYYNISHIIVNSSNYNELVRDIQDLKEDIQNASTDEIKLKKSEKLSEKQEQLELLKENVSRLYETFNKISLNTERLQKAKIYFDAGQFKEADVLLNAEEIASEIEHLQDSRKRKEQELEKIDADLIDKSNEYLIKAQIWTTFYSEPDWYDKAEKYFKEALKAAQTVETLFKYALFLQKNNQFSKALDVIKKLHSEHFSELTPQQKAEFYQIAANLELKAGDQLKEVVYCFNNAFSYWFDLTKEKITEEQQLTLVSLYIDVGNFWDRTFINSKDDESVFAEAYALLWKTRKVMNNMRDAFGGKIATSNSWLLGVIFNELKSNQKMVDDFNYDKNIHRLMNSHEILSAEAHNHAYIINESVTTSDNLINKYEALCNRSEILTDKAGHFLHLSNQLRNEGTHHAVSSLHYYAMAMESLELISNLAVQQKDDFEIEKKRARIHINISCVYRKLQFFGLCSYELKGFIAELIALSDKPTGDEPLAVNCEQEELAHINKGIEMFERLYLSNPAKHRNFLCTNYLMRAEFYDKRDRFDEEIRDCERAIELCKQISHDTDPNSGLYKSYIESELHLAHVYMRDKVNDPVKAVPHFENAIKICEDLAVKLPDVYEWKLVELYTEAIKAYASLGELEKAKEILFDKSHKILLKLLAADHRSNDGMWEKWLDVVELCFMNLQGQFKDGQISIDIWREWLEETWDVLRVSCVKWNAELEKDVNILLPVVCRYVNEDGREEYVTKHMREEYETILCRIVMTLASMYNGYQQKEAAIEFLAAVLRTYSLIAHRIIVNTGILRHSIYFHEIQRVEYNKFVELLSKIDGGEFKNAVTEFQRLKAKIAFKYGNPVETEDMKWSDIIEIYHEMLSIADENAILAHVYCDDVAECHGHLGYAYSMNGEKSKAEKHLVLCVNMLRKIETYDLANKLAVSYTLYGAQISLGNFYHLIGDYHKAIETWVEPLKMMLDFVNEYGLNVIDRSKTQAGFVGSTTPLLDSRLIGKIMLQIAQTLEDIRETENIDAYQAIYAKYRDVINAIGIRVSSPAYYMIPFKFYELLHFPPESAEGIKTEYAELLELIKKHEIAAAKQVPNEMSDDYSHIWYVPTDANTQAFFAFIKRNLVGFFSKYFPDIDK